MKTFDEFMLVEHYVTTNGGGLTDADHHAAHHVLLTSYKGVEGGYGGKGSGSSAEHQDAHKDLKNPNHIVKLKKVAGKVVSAVIYKKNNGRKLIAGGTDGSQHGKDHLKKILGDDHKHKRAWAEVSGALGHIMKKQGHPEISHEHAEHLTGKHVIEHHHDRNSYTRLIGGDVHEKQLVGHPASTPQVKK